MSHRMVSIRRLDTDEIEIRIAAADCRLDAAAGVKEMSVGHGMSANLPVDAAEAVVMAMFRLIEEIRADREAGNAIAAIDMRVPAIREGSS